MSNALRREISRRYLLKMFGMGSAAMFLQACGGGAPAPAGDTGGQPAADEGGAPAAGGGVETGELKVFVCCYAPAEVELREKFNQEFEQAHPGVTINMELLPAGQNYFEKLQTLIASGTTPDVFDMWEGYVQPYAANGVLMELDQFLQTDSEINKDDILPAAMDASSYEGKVYALLIGYMPGPVSLYYNVDHFEQAGLEPPSPDWTWDDMRNAAKQLTQDTDGDGTPEQWGLVFANWFVPWTYWIWSNGGDVFNEDETQCTLTEEKAVQAIQYWADLVNVDKVAIPPSQTQALGGELNLFQTGAASMYLGNTWDVGQLKESQDIQWKSVLSPRANDGNRTWYMHTWCWAMSTQTQKPNLAWEYMRDFVLNRTIEPATPTIPPLQQLLPTFDKPENIELGYEPLIDIATEPDQFRIPGSGAKWDKISGLIQAEMDLVFSGEKSAADAMAAACPEVDEELARQDATLSGCRPGCAS